MKTQKKLRKIKQGLVFLTKKLRIAPHDRPDLIYIPHKAQIVVKVAEKFTCSNRMRIVTHFSVNESCITQYDPFFKSAARYVASCTYIFHA